MEERKKEIRWHQRKFVALITFLVILVGSTFIIYFGSIPKKYSLKVGDTSEEDIIAGRSIPDKIATEERAQKVSQEVAIIMLRSAQIAEASELKLAEFFEAINKARTELYQPLETAIVPAEDDPDGTETSTFLQIQKHPSTDEIDEKNEELWTLVNTLMTDVSAKNFSKEDIRFVLLMAFDRFSNFQAQCQESLNFIEKKDIDTVKKDREISNYVTKLKEQNVFYQADADVIGKYLQVFAAENVTVDAAATDKARKIAYENIIKNPIMIDRGSRIISQNEVVTEDKYELLKAMDLTETQAFDYKYFIGLFIFVLILLSIAMVYLNYFEGENLKRGGNKLVLLFTMLLPLLVSGYFTRSYPLTAPVYFAAVIITGYFGFKTAITMSWLLIMAILPMTNFSVLFPAVAFIGVIVASYFSMEKQGKDHYAIIILAVTLMNFFVTLALCLVQKLTWQVIYNYCLQTSISGLLAIICAIGIAPLFEMFFNTISPLRLIELSKTDHPLLRRLFLEAPGTSQHSMMVANLGGAAAAAININSQIVRVGAYYHDIGKLENPLMFTENQEEMNPHDYLTPEESADVIIAHPRDGVKLAKPYRLPLPILKIMMEHHGTTVLAYFYDKACRIAEKEAEKNGEDGDATIKVEKERFRYPGPIPSSKESAVVMLADSSEAAIKSIGAKDIVEIEKIIRSVIKVKVDQNQLINSSLSFKDVEVIIKAFVQVYAGYFHERIKYPSDRPIQQSK